MSDAKAEVTKVLQKYVDSSYIADAAGLREVFHPQAVMNGYIVNDLVLATPEAYIADITSKPSLKDAGHPFKAEIKDVQVTGKAASAAVHETGFAGLAFTDYMHLVEIDGRWWIMSKNFQGTPE